LFEFKFGEHRRHFAFDDPKLRDRVDDNEYKFDEGQSKSLLAGENFGIVTNIVTGPDGNLYVTSLSNGAVYMISANHTRSRTAEFAADHNSAMNPAGVLMTDAVNRHNAGPASTSLDLNAGLSELFVHGGGMNSSAMGSVPFATSNVANVQEQSLLTTSSHGRKALSTAAVDAALASFGTPRTIRPRW
jgi:hypothetical protein